MVCGPAASAVADGVNLATLFVGVTVPSVVPSLTKAIDPVGVPVSPGVRVAVNVSRVEFAKKVGLGAAWSCSVVLIPFTCWLSTPPVLLRYALLLAMNCAVI